MISKLVFDSLCLLFVSILSVEWRQQLFYVKPELNASPVAVTVGIEPQSCIHWSHGRNSCICTGEYVKRAEITGIDLQTIRSLSIVRKVCVHIYIRIHKKKIPLWKERGLVVSSWKEYSAAAGVRDQCIDIDIHWMHRSI